jgi:hypothetical protein
MALYSLFKLTVLCAIFHAAAAVSRQPPPSALARASFIRALPRSLPRTPPENTRFHAQETACTGTRSKTEATNPSGLYYANNIPVGSMGKVTYVDLIFPAQDFSGFVTYKQDLRGCAFVPPIPDKCIDFFGTQTMTFKKGRFNGNQLIPVAGDDINPFEKGIDELLHIEWCPDQNQFLVSVMGQGPYPLVHKPKVAVAVAAV